MDLISYEEAIRIAGHLSFPSKMPCPSWGIDPKHCKTGQKLRKKKGTTCSICYACRGHYNYPLVRKRQEERLQGIDHQFWVDAMIVLIKAQSCTHFRWLDSGDLQSLVHLLKIILIAIRMPSVKFWLPTQEHKLVRYFEKDIPQNLTIRLTNAVIDPKYEVRTHLPTASVETCDKEQWCGGYSIGRFYCPADGKDKKECGNCRACWDKNTTHIVYRRN